jgi:two-component system alkaline phosphatase synthesis response regulator PhoP
MTNNILLVEDEAALRMTIGDRLQSEGYVVNFAQNGREALDKATRLPFDLILLDVMLPEKNGFDVCRELRAQGLATPIIMLTARTQTVDKVVGLKLGADDYVTKPFEMPELLARIEALLRRAPYSSQHPLPVIRAGDLEIDLRGTQVMRDGQAVPLSAREFQLLRFFVERRGETLSRDVLLKEVWGYNARTFTRTVDVHVASLRQKLERDPRQPALILTITGLGYKFPA